jgi:hypothetical protein
MPRGLLDADNVLRVVTTKRVGAPGFRAQREVA